MKRFQHIKLALIMLIISLFLTLSKSVFPLEVIEEIRVGDGPVGMVMTPDGKRLYVAHYASDDVYVIDTATYKVIARIPVGDNPFYPAITPDGTRVYVPNYLGNSISVIDTETNTVIKTIETKEGPVDIAITPDGTHGYIAHFVKGSWKSGYISVIDTELNTVIRTFSLDGKNYWCDAYAVDISPDGNWAYITCDGATATSRGGLIEWGGIIRINTKTNEMEVGAWPGNMENPKGIVFSPSGREAYVVDRGRSKIRRIGTADMAAPRLQIEIPIGGKPTFTLTLSPDGTKLYVPSNKGVGIIDTSMDILCATIDLNGKKLEDIVISPDGTRLYASSSDNDTGTVIIADILDLPECDREFDPHIINYLVVPKCNDIVWDNQNYLWGASDGTLTKINPANGEVLTTITVAEYTLGLTWDGSYLWYSDYEPNKIYKVDPNTGEQIISFPAPYRRTAAARGLAWDGEFLWVADYPNDIFKVNPDTGATVKSFTIGGMKKSIVGLAYDGEYLLAISTGDNKIYKIDPNSGTVVFSLKLTHTTSVWGLAWDGQHVWVSDYKYLYQISHPEFDRKPDYGSISGTVVNQKTMEPISDVIVQVTQDGQIKGSAKTESDGEYTVDHLQEGTYTVNVLVTEHVAPEPKKVTVVVGETKTGVDFALIPIPVITSIQPVSGFNNTDTSITITGKYFENGATVKIGKTDAINVKVIDSNKITATVPQGVKQGVYDVTITNPDGHNGKKVNVFTVIIPIPVITSIQPAGGFTNSDTSITIIGKHFEDGATVKIGTTDAINVKVIDSTKITATVPQGVKQSAYDVTVTNPDGHSGKKIRGFTVTAEVETALGQSFKGIFVFVAKGDIWVWAEGTPASVNITNSTEEETECTISPNGKEILFTRNGQIWKMNVDGSNQLLLKDERGNIHVGHSPAWSPDGSKVAYLTGQYNSQTNSHPYVMNPDGSAGVLYDKKFAQKIAWAPGKDILTSTLMFKGRAIFSNVWRITTTAAGELGKGEMITNNEGSIILESRYQKPSWAMTNDKVAYVKEPMFAGDLPGQIYVLDLAGNEIATIRDANEDFLLSIG